jgi:cell pole-organizing protein PopZ
MSQPAKAQEPSMEEILASIRRIIADDDGGKPPAKPEPAATPAPRPAAVTPRPAAPPQPAPESSSVAKNQRDVDDMTNRPGASAGEAVERDPTDVLELTESMAAPSPGLPNFQTIDGQPDVVFSDAPASDPAPRVTEEMRRPYSGNGLDHSLLSSATTEAVDSAFNTLAQTVLVHNARTLEDLVREMLRPMLKSWLDDNLPGLVERIVRAEIERVSRGRG